MEEVPIPVPKMTRRASLVSILKSANASTVQMIDGQESLKEAKIKKDNGEKKLKELTILNEQKE